MVELGLPSYLSDTQIHMREEEPPTLVDTLPAPAPSLECPSVCRLFCSWLHWGLSSGSLTGTGSVCLSLPRSHIYLITIEDESHRLGLSGQ